MWCFKFRFWIRRRKLKTSVCWIGTQGRKTDGQLDMPDNSGKEEYLPVILSGVGITILLGIPALPHTSIKHKGNVWGILKWNIEDCVSGVVFDSTSNKGTYFKKRNMKQLLYCDRWFNEQLWHVRLSNCIDVQHIMKKAPLWYACCHHVREVVCSVIFRIPWR